MSEIRGLYGWRDSRLLFAEGEEEAAQVMDGLPLGVYEGLRTFGERRLFALEEHLRRLARSARHFGLPDPPADLEPSDHPKNERL